MQSTYAMKSSFLLVNEDCVSKNCLVNRQEDKNFCRILVFDEFDLADEILIFGVCLSWKRKSLIFTPRSEQTSIKVTSLDCIVVGLWMSISLTVLCTVMRAVHLFCKTNLFNFCSASIGEKWKPNRIWIFECASCDQCDKLHELNFAVNDTIRSNNETRLNSMQNIV